MDQMSEFDYKGYPILFVDDKLSALKTLMWSLEEDFTIDTTDDPDVALQMIAGKRYAVILSDQQMPQMSGAELLAKVKEIAPQTVRVLITGHADLASAINNINQGGVYRYIQKSSDPRERDQLIKEAIHHYCVTSELQRVNAIVGNCEEDVVQIGPLKGKKFLPFVESCENLPQVSGWVDQYAGLAALLAKKEAIADDAIRERAQLISLVTRVYHVIDTVRAKLILQRYFSEEEMATFFLNRYVTRVYLLEYLEQRMEYGVARQRAVDVMTVTAPLSRVVLLGPKQSILVQQNLGAIYYRRQNAGEKVIITDDVCEGVKLDIRDDEAFDAISGERMGTPEEFFKWVVSIVSGNRELGQVLIDLK